MNPVIGCLVRNPANPASVPVEVTGVGEAPGQRWLRVSWPGHTATGEQVMQGTVCDVEARAVVEGPAEAWLPAPYLPPAERAAVAAREHPVTCTRCLRGRTWNLSAVCDRCSARAVRGDRSVVTAVAR